MCKFVKTTQMIKNVSLFFCIRWQRAGEKRRLKKRIIFCMLQMRGMLRNWQLSFRWVYVRMFTMYVRENIKNRISSSHLWLIDNFSGTILCKFSSLFYPFSLWRRRLLVEEGKREGNIRIIEGSRVKCKGEKRDSSFNSIFICPGSGSFAVKTLLCLHRWLVIGIGEKY